MPIIRRLTFVLALMSVLNGAASLEAQSELDGEFATAIESAQQRTVKVYGATAGRVDGYASGVIVSPDGLIVTMQGVFLDGQKTRVTLHDGRQVAASVLRRDRNLQLALLKIAEETPDFFELSSEPVGKAGDWVVTLCNAFKVADGVEPMSVNLGIISLRTTIEARISPRDIAYAGPLVLIDAITSNPGAGGGAVVTTSGQLVGTIGRVINSSETNTRLNYAVPSDILKQFVAGELTADAPLVATDRVPGEIGMELFRMAGRQAPAYIDRVSPDTPADAAGLRPDDLVISLGGEKIGTIREFDAAMKNVFADEEVIIVVKRGRELIRVPLVPVPSKGPSQ